MAYTELNLLPKRVDTANIDKAKRRFLKAQPMPQISVVDEEGDPTFDENNNFITEDKYTFIQWMSQRAWTYLRGEVKQGKRIEDAEDNEELIID